MKVILFVPKMYSLSELLKVGFESNGWVVKIADYKDMVPNIVSAFYDRTVGLPNKISKYWKPKYYKEINKRYIDFVGVENPDMILIYNNQFFFPETLNIIRQNCKIVFYLGDNPLWSNTFDYNLQILQYADYTISPDSHWTNELSSIGMPNIYNDFIGCSDEVFFKTKVIPTNIYKKYKSDIIFVGSNYSDASGYKRALFMSKFVDFDFKIFGNGSWKRWLKHFPELNESFNYLETRISDAELNYAINSAKIYVIDQNTGIVNGIHNRVFEVIGAGCLPIVEWRKDLDTHFDANLPTIKNYEETEIVVRKFLNNESLRLETVNSLRLKMEENFNPKIFVKRIIDNCI